MSNLKVTFSKAPANGYETAILCFYSDKEKCASFDTVNYEMHGFLDHALEHTKKFKGKYGDIEILMVPEDSHYSRVVLLGLGDKDKLNPVDAEKIGGKLYVSLKAENISNADFYADNDNPKSEELAAHFANGVKLRSYDFKKYKTPKPDEDKPTLFENLHFVLRQSEKAEKLYDDFEKVADGVFFARDLVNEPPNELVPDTYARRIRDELKPLGVEIDIFDEKKMEKFGMGAILSVGKGSYNPPRMVIMRWIGDRSISEGPLAIVGKGVTFDTGGISLKPAAGMEDMKMDMGGSAAVVGLMKALAGRKAKTNVIGIVGLAENMPSGNATRPADIIKSYSGKTIEVLNTDAEGRLVLADCLSYVQERYNPRLIIDLATLTGAMLVALGHEYCGTFSTDDGLWDHMNKAGEETGEKLWRMPLDEYWKKDMEGTISDIQNMAQKSTRIAGSCTAAGFLWHFIKEGVPWAHMDIAGTAWIKEDRDLTPKYGTGFGVRVLDRMIANFYENA
ncbi:MAG: leucyl aminopeptidase [Alphaproteobacteria bacterium]|nr:leucyl aminopeptidase [Alphaproteobacteria bacterium]